MIHEFPDPSFFVTPLCYMRYVGYPGRYFLAHKRTEQVGVIFMAIVSMVKVKNHSMVNLW